MNDRDVLPFFYFRVRDALPCCIHIQPWPDDIDIEIELKSSAPPRFRGEMI